LDFYSSGDEELFNIGNSKSYMETFPHIPIPVKNSFNQKLVKINPPQEKPKICFTKKILHKLFPCKQTKNYNLNFYSFSYTYFVAENY
jgi:hypothetical protein